MGTIIRFVIAIALFAGSVAVANDTAREWVDAEPRFTGGGDSPRRFVAVGGSDAAVPGDWKTELAEREAEARITALVSRWQEETMRCADPGRAADEATRLYRPRVLDRTWQGRRLLVLVSQDLQPLMNGILADANRSQPLKDAVRTCGERAFDQLAGGLWRAEVDSTTIAP